jgi:ABC-type uncharacterized transport system auxiliary subunit
MTRTRALALLAVLLAGCALTSKGTPEEVTWYTPEPNPAANAKASAPVGPALRLGRVTSGSGLGERIAHSDGAYQVRYYDGRRWTERPDHYVERALGRALFEVQGFQHGDVEAPALDVDVLGFEEVNAPGVHSARIAVRVRLQAQGKVLFEDGVSASEPVQGLSFDAVVAAMARALDALAADVARRVAVAMAARIPAAPSAAK